MKKIALLVALLSLVPFVADAQVFYGPATVIYPTTPGDCVKFDNTLGGGYLADAGPCGGGTGTVTSVALSLPNIFTVSGSPVTTSGTLAATLATEAANIVFAGPTTGSAAAPTFRALVAADIPSLAATYLPLAGGTMAGVLNIPVSDLSLTGSSSGASILNAPATGGGTLTLPTGTGTIAALNLAQTFTAQQTDQGASGTSPGWYAQITGDTTPRVRVGLNINDVASIGFGSGSTTRDLFLERAAAATLRQGTQDVASPVAQIFNVQSVVTGTTDGVGALWKFQDSSGTGAGLSGGFEWDTHPAGTTGTSQNAAFGTLKLSSTSLIVSGHNVNGSFVSYRNDDTPAAHASGAFKVDGNNASGTETTFAQFTGTSATLTAGAEIGSAQFGVMGGLGTPGSLQNMITLTGGASAGTAVVSFPTGEAVTIGSGLTNEGTKTLNVGGGYWANNIAAIDASDNATFVLGTFSDQLTESRSGASTISPFQMTGAILTGATATNNLPAMFIQPTGTTAATSWSTSGTGLGMNLASGFAGNFLDFHAAGAASVFSVSSGGSIVMNGNVTLPTGGGVFWAGRSLLTSSADGNIKITNNAGTSFNLFQLGGTTSSFSAIKNNGAALNFRLADDSADAGITAGTATLSGALTYGGVTLTNSAQGTGAMVLATAPTLSSPRISTLIGGTSASQAMIIESTSGVGTTDKIDFKTGSQSIFMSADTNGLITLPKIGSDAGHNDTSICQDTTTHALYSGSGTLGVCLGTSSARYKRNIHAMSDGLAKILQLKPDNFFYLSGHGDNGTHEQYGFIAEDVVKVLPKLVALDKQKKPNSVDILGIVPVLVKAVQQQQQEIITLKAVNDNLSGRLAKLERHH